MPPTIIFTVVFAPPPPEPAEPPPATLLAQAPVPRTNRTATAAATLRTMLCSLDIGGCGKLRRAPAQQAPFQPRDEPLGGQRDDGDDEHGGVHAVGVERAARLVDEQPETVLGADELADDGADEREPEGDVQAGDDPRHRGRHDHLPGHLTG